MENVETGRLKSAGSIRLRSMPVWQVSKANGGDSVVCINHLCAHPGYLRSFGVNANDDLYGCHLDCVAVALGYVCFGLCQERKWVMKYFVVVTAPQFKQVYEFTKEAAAKAVYFKLKASGFKPMWKEVFVG